MATTTGVDFLGGVAGGVLQCVVGHPLDTLKVRLQTRGAVRGAQGSPAGVLQTARSMLAKEGVWGFYKGVQSPLVANGLLQSVLFGTNAACRSVVARLTDRDARALPLTHVVAAALLTAPVYCAFVCPVDVVKCRLQVQVEASTAAAVHYRGALHCLLHTARTEGAAGLLRGYTATVCMRWVGLPCYFVTYDGAKRALLAAGGDDALTTTTVLAAGGLAGTVFWAVSFPLDTIKTRLQAGGEGTSRAILPVVRQLLQEGGVRAFYSGFLPCVLRAAPANAAAFVGLEGTRRLFEGVAP